MHLNDLLRAHSAAGGSMKIEEYLARGEHFVFFAFKMKMLLNEANYGSAEVSLDSPWWGTMI